MKIRPEARTSGLWNRKSGTERGGEKGGGGGAKADPGNTGLKSGLVGDDRDNNGVRATSDK